VAERCVCIFSGGLDSTTLAYYCQETLGREVLLLSFDYGQRHDVELRHAEQLAEKLAAPWRTMDLTGFGDLVVSALTSDEVDVPEGEYSEENIQITEVPNRNMVMLSIAAGYAMDQQARFVSYGAHSGGDGPTYSDCTPGFVDAVNRAVGEAAGPHREVIIEAPFVNKTKGEIVRIGHDLGVPFELTWSCYAGGDVHCGRCGTCQDRAKAFIAAGVSDPTRYRHPPG
jgi:7-cyano-7-deazaguanine synthase